MSDTDTKIDDGGPAFPKGDDSSPQDGMSFRNYLAAKAMQAFLSNAYALQQLDNEITAAKREDERRAHTINRVLSKRAFMLADTMIAESKKGK